MDFLTQFLASIFDKFKIANPKVAAIVLFLLSVLVTTSNQGVVFGIFSAPVWLVTAVKFVSAFLLAVTGSRTVRWLNQDSQ